MPKSRGRPQGRRKKRPARGGPVSSRNARPPAGLVKAADDEIRAQVRTLLADDPAIGMALTGPLPPLQGQWKAPPPQIPVVLFELEAGLLVENPGGPVQELQVATGLAAGLRPCPPGALAAERIPGWSVVQRPDGLDLVVGGGNVWASGPVTPDAEWLRLADAHGQVLVLYGTLLGVRVPGKLTPGQYTVATRRAELERARQDGEVACGVVRWAAAGAEQPGFALLDLRQLGIPMPAFAFPLDELLVHGRPEDFGFEHFGKRDAAVPLPETTALAVDLHQGPNDVDVTDVRRWVAPSEPPMLVGLHSEKPRPAFFDEAAAEEGRLMLLATTMNARTQDIVEVLATSYGCLARLMLRAYSSGIGTLPPPDADRPGGL